MSNAAKLVVELQLGCRVLDLVDQCGQVGGGLIDVFGSKPVLVREHSERFAPAVADHDRWGP
jgi:hypothetical protein